MKNVRFRIKDALKAAKNESDDLFDAILIKRILEEIRNPTPEMIREGFRVVETVDNNEYGPNVVVIKTDPAMVFRAMMDVLIKQYRSG